MMCVCLNVPILTFNSVHRPIYAVGGHLKQSLITKVQVTETWLTRVFVRQKRHEHHLLSEHKTVYGIIFCRIYANFV